GTIADGDVEGARTHTAFQGTATFGRRTPIRAGGLPSAGDVGLELAQQARFRHGTDERLDNLTVHVDVHRRDADHAVAAGDRRVGVGVELGDVDLVGVGGGGFPQDRG